ncbi:hepcidin-1 isoform X1 [Pimephales promelas]|uniref:hepcidin-1 isoform X1 n=1 Tax=Pimephales promelas TaxID=90988 RepID=UPI0019557416|nr:hepcidin-1 isoform X1 [Pimephales promelas]
MSTGSLSRDRDGPWRRSHWSRCVFEQKIPLITLASLLNKHQTCPCPLEKEHSSSNTAVTVLIRVSRVGQELTERVEQVKGLDRRSINSRAVPVITTPENKPNRTETLLQS